jgi:hypothetical protein
VKLNIEVRKIVTKKSNFNLKVANDFAVEQTLEEQIIAAALNLNPKRVSLSIDENGNVIIGKEEHPDIYEWVVNG